MKGPQQSVPKQLVVGIFVAIKLLVDLVGELRKDQNSTYSRFLP